MHETREAQARPNPSIERAVRHKLPLLAEEPMATGPFWQRESQFFLRVVKSPLLQGKTTQPSEKHKLNSMGLKKERDGPQRAWGMGG